MPLEPGTQIGRYLVLRSLASGGMAEVYLARSSGPSGFSKVLVLKIIQPALSEEAEFLRMFRNEATLAALLNHPNVVQVFDFGVEADQHYMAMEYIDGQSLSRVLRALEKLGQRLPLSTGLFVIGQICEALVYAHHLTDSDGRSLNIVHRDVSPENILLSYAGHVKLVDFGLVKARTLDGKTSESVVKGKYAYIAPELLQGIPYDHRADLFSLGVVLYRSVLGRMPFAGEHPAEIFYQILERAPIPPRQLDPGLPPELERVILRALAKDPDARYPRARELQRDLEAVARDLGGMATGRELAELMIATFPPGMDDLRQSYQQLAGVLSRTPTRERYIPEASPTPASAGERSPSLTVPTTAAAPRARRRQTEGSLPTMPDLGGTAPGPRRRPWATIAGVAVGALVAVALIGLLRPDRQRRSFWRPPEAGQVLRLTADAAVRASASVPDARLVQPRDGGTPRSEHKAWLHVSAPGPAEVFLDGHHVGSVPFRSKALEPGPHQLRVRSSSVPYEVTRRLKLAAGEHLRLNVQPGRGTIRVLVHPFAQVTIDGRVIGPTPFPPVSVFEGPHLVVLENAALKVSKSIRVRVKARQQRDVKERLDR